MTLQPQQDAGKIRNKSKADSCLCHPLFVYLLYQKQYTMIKIRHCIQCYKGNEKWSNKKHHPYCSYKCKNIHTGVVRKCKGCDKDFIPKIGSQMHCKTKCVNLANKKKNITTKYKASSYLIFSRTNFCCIYCGKSSVKDDIKLVVDHVYPLKHGGNSDVYNLAAACSKCNSQKQDKIMPDDLILSIWQNNIDFDLISGLRKSYSELKDYFTKLNSPREPR